MPIKNFTVVSDTEDSIFGIFKIFQEKKAWHEYHREINCLCLFQYLGRLYQVSL